MFLNCQLNAVVNGKSVSSGAGKSAHEAIFILVLVIFILFSFFINLINFN